MTTVIKGLSELESMLTKERDLRVPGNLTISDCPDANLRRIMTTGCLSISPDVIGERITVESITAEFAWANMSAIKADTIHVIGSFNFYEIDCKSIKANAIICQNIKADTIEATDVHAGAIETKSIMVTGELKCSRLIVNGIEYEMDAPRSKTPGWHPKGV